MEGTQVGAYRLLRRIGEGGMGSVWLVEHAMLGRSAALKMLHPEYSNNSEIVTRFFNEARAATAIPDPGIVQIFDFGRHSDGSAYIVMELLDGEPLDRRLARHGALGLTDALRIMRQVANTLGAAHALGIVHRDLKPENIFIVRDPEVPGGERAKILDFGIAKLAGDHGGIKTQTKAVMGTPTYMSPEQCRGAGQVDQRSDVYAMGCVLFTLLVGRPPFDADGMGDIIAMHLREPPPAPSRSRRGIPPKIDRLVLRCLAKDPAQRFDHGGEFALALSNLLASSSQSGALDPGTAYAAASAPTTLSSAAGERASRTTGRRHAAMIAGLGTAIVGGVVTIAVTRSDSDPVSPETAPLATSASETPAKPPAPKISPPPTPPLEKPDSNTEMATRMKDILARFVAWSRDHQSAPCPEPAALGAPPPDPWGHAFRLTCTDQPGDQIVGAISAGPDGVQGTTDDIASWQIGRGVTESVRGARWSTAPTPPGAPSASAKPAPRPSADTKASAPAAQPEQTKPAGVKPAEPSLVKSRPAATKPVDGPKPNPKPNQGQRGKAVELDEFGLPKKR